MAAGAALLLLRAGITVVSGSAPPLMANELIPSLVVAGSLVVALGAVFAYFLIFNGRVTAELARQAHLDPLTELLNRRGFEERAGQEVQRAARTGIPISLLMIDANEFKAINDKWGHLAGDDALRAIANGLRSKVRPYDLVGRMGGDEFVVLMPGIDAAQARAMVPRLREAIASQTTGHPFKLDVGIGRGTLPPVGSGKAASVADAADLVRRLIAEADKDLYSVKNTRS